MIIICSGDFEMLEQIIKQCMKLIDVVYVIDYIGQVVIEIEIVFIKICCELDQCIEILQIVEQYYVKIVDYGIDLLMVCILGLSDKLDVFVVFMYQFQIVEMVCLGKILMVCGYVII